MEASGSGPTASDPDMYHDPLQCKQDCTMQLTPEGRDMRRELEAWRQARSARKSATTRSKNDRGSRQSSRSTYASKENTVNRVTPHRKTTDSNQACATPVKNHPHVNAVSPLSEVCQNNGTFLTPIHSCGHALQSMDPAGDAASAVSSMVAAWEEQVRMPRVPPTSPANEFTTCSQGGDPSMVPELFPYTLAAALNVVLDGADTESTSPEQHVSTRMQAMPVEWASFMQKTHPRPQRLLERLEQAEFEDVEEANTSTSICAAPVEYDNQEIINETEHWEDEIAEQQMHDQSIEEEWDELASLRYRLQRHAISWPQPTTLEMEDHLSRSYDIIIFWFFEMRDRTNNALQEIQNTKEPLECIHEYPLEWPQWRIHSFDFREAARAARAGARQRFQLTQHASDEAQDDEVHVLSEQDSNAIVAGGNYSKSLAFI